MENTNRRKWNAIETAPKDGQPLRVYDPLLSWTATLEILAEWTGWCWRTTKDRKILHPTFWMYSKEPPQN